MESFCNFGYGRGLCPQFPEHSQFDAVRFSITLGGRMMYVLERDYSPLQHGPVDGAVRDECIARQAAASLAAFRHARKPVVTASVDHMNFLFPVHIGQLLVLRSMVNRVFRTSMEVGVRVCVEDLMTGEVRHTSSAYLTFVALGKDGHPEPIPPAFPETEEEKRRYADAAVRREHRLALRRKVLG